VVSFFILSIIFFLA